MNKYEKELEILQKEHNEKHAAYKKKLEEHRKAAEKACEKYNTLLGVINSERHLIRDELRSLFMFLKNLGDVGIPITIFDYEIELPEKLSIDDLDAVESLYDKDPPKNKLRDATLFMVSPALLLTEKAIGGIIKRSKDKKNLAEKLLLTEEKYTEWDNQLNKAESSVKFHETSAKIADLYRAVIATVSDTIKYTIIPELDGIAAFLSAYSIKDAIIYGENPDEVTQNRIDEFLGTPYETHYIFVKNTFEYYHMIKTFFTTTVLTNIISDHEITKEEEEDFEQKTNEIKEKGNQLSGMTSFGG